MDSGEDMKSSCDRALVALSLSLALFFTGAAMADPVSPPEHLEKDYVAIGSGLYLRRDDDLSADSDGNSSVLIFSRAGISAAPGYTVDFMVAWDMNAGQRVDAGSLGILRLQAVNIDCTHRTYAAYKLGRQMPAAMWRPASDLPAISPVFAYVCPILKAKAAEAAKAAALAADRARHAEEEQRRAREAQQEIEKQQRQAMEAREEARRKAEEARARIISMPDLANYYPSKSVKSGEQGLVRVRVCYDTTGKVIQATLDMSSGFSRLDAAAVSFASAVRIKPATVDGVPTEDCLVAPVRFGLKDQ